MSGLENLNRTLSLIDLAKRSEVGELNTQLVEDFNSLRRDIGLAALLTLVASAATLAASYDTKTDVTEDVGVRSSQS